MSGFRKHILEAINLNRKRRTYYAKVTDGQTKKLSNWLIFLERFVIPIAFYFDLRARRFNQQGIGIVRDDFLAMDVVDEKTPALYKNEMTAEVIEEIRSLIKLYAREVSRLRELTDINDLTFDFYKKITDFESGKRVHLAMLKHLVESIWYISKNGITYAEQSQGRTTKLSRQLLKLHFIGLSSTLFLDKAANRHHRNGVGIIVNDLPEIKPTEV